MPGLKQSMLARREHMVFDWCASRAVPVAFVLAGGYLSPRLDRGGLVSLHRETIAAAALHGSTLRDGTNFCTARAPAGSSHR